MNNQKQLPNQTQANKANKNRKTSSQMHPQASPGVENQTHLIPPNLLQHALENPQAARPETILQLQRQYGNRAVSQLLAQQGANRANAPSGPKLALGSSPAVIQARLTHTLQQTGSIQRMIDFKFTTDVGMIASLMKPHDQMFQPIIKTFKEYKEASTKDKVDEEYRLLKELKKLCKTWLDTYGGKYPNKTTDLETLLPKIEEELNTRKFADHVNPDKLLGKIMDTFREYREAMNKKWINAEYELLKELKEQCGAWITLYGRNEESPKKRQVVDIFVEASEGLTNPKFADQMKSDRQIEKIKAYKYKKVTHEHDKLFEVRNKKNAWMTAPPDQQEEVRERQKKKIEDLKKLNLTKAERLAITSYTNENYALINPAISGDKKWLEDSLSNENKSRENARGKMDKRHHHQFLELDTSPQGMAEAVAENKKIAKLAQAGLNKLPNWKQDQPLYRGDTFSKEEGQKLIKGNKKTYPHFVSTSEDTLTPRSYADGKRSVERPVGIVWHITKSQHGKNVADLSANEGEKEILFPANTTFQIDEVISEKPDTRGIMKELKVQEG